MRAIIASLCATGLLAGCATTAAPNQEVFTAGPSTPAMSADSYLRDALTCMDDLLSRANDRHRGVVLLVLPPEDPTGSVNAGMRSMVIDAALEMTRRSRYFNVTDFVTGEELSRNGILVRTEVVEYDQGLYGGSQGGGIGTDPLEIGRQSNQTISSLALNIRLIDSATRQVLPGGSSTHRIALEDRDRGTDMRGEIGTVAGFLEFRIARTQALHQSAQALVDLNMIEVIGEYAGVAYEQCLVRSSANLGGADQDAQDYARMDQTTLAASIARALWERGYYTGPTQISTLTPQLRQSIAAYQRDHALAVTGSPTMELFAGLDLGTRDTASDPFPTDDAFFISLRPANSNLFLPPDNPYLPRLIANLGESYFARASSRIEVSATLNRPGYLLCFHISSNGDIVRVYPNDQRPERRIEANNEVRIPSSLDRFVIQPSWRARYSAGVRTPEELNKRLEYFFCQARERPFAQDWPAGWGSINGPVSALPYQQTDHSLGGANGLVALSQSLNAEFGQGNAWGQVTYLTMPSGWNLEFEIQSLVDQFSNQPAASR